MLPAILACLLAFSGLPVPGQTSAGSNINRVVTFMTQNLYVGADLDIVMTTTTREEIVSAVTAVYSSAQATDFPQRAETLASEIAKAPPDLIGLQEVALWRSQTHADLTATLDAKKVQFDFLRLLRKSLAARRLHYRPVVISTTTDVEAPRLTNSGLQDIRLTDREVILARTGNRGARLRFSSARKGTFTTNLIVTNAVAGPFTVLRGWASVDVRLGGKTFRLVSTHLDPNSEDVRVAQAGELMQRTADTTLPVVLLGDFNSDADVTSSPTYHHLITAGFQDCWTLVNAGDPGYTCCQDADLLNPTSALASRIDLVLFRGAAIVTGASVLGNSPADKTQSGLWSSDHAGVTATLQFP